MRKLAKLRLIGLILAVTTLGATAYFIFAAWQANTDFQNWQTERPMQVQLDLSKRGMVSVPFQQTCVSAHSEGIYLDCTILNESQQIPQGLLRGLVASIRISDSAGNEVLNQSLRDNFQWQLDGQVELANFLPFARGDYQATIEIDSGVPALADRPQTLYARYNLCGMEQAPVAIYGFLAFCAGVVFLFAGVIVFPDVRRVGIWKPVSPVESAEDAPSSLP